MHILIAEDDRTTAAMLGRSLESWGFRVTVVHDGVTGWARMTEADPPALVIADWMMPGLDGLELCRRIRAASVASYAYVILLSARTGRRDLVEGLEAGADDYLTKPFDPDELRARIHVGQRTLALVANIKQLTGLLPICSYCKRIRSDQNYWEQVDSYIAKHTDVRFSHSICPACYARALADLDDPQLDPAGTDK